MHQAKTCFCWLHKMANLAVADQRAAPDGASGIGPALSLMHMGHWHDSHVNAPEGGHSHLQLVAD